MELFIVDAMRFGAWLRSVEGISDGSRLALSYIYQTLSIECPSSIFFWHVLCVIVPFFLTFLFCFCFVFVFTLSLELVPLVYDG